MKRIFIFLLILTSITINSQENYSQLTDKLLFGGDLGFTFTSSDYKDVGIGLMIRGVGEYYLYERASHKFGIRGFLGYGISSGSDNRFDPDGFSTQLYTAALGGIYSLQVSESISPYLFLGLRFLRFNPNDKEGNKLPNNIANEYDQNLFNLALEFGIRFQISDELYGYGSLVPFSLSNDYIDDRASGSAKDIVVTLNFGLLYSFIAPWVSSESGYNDELPLGVTERENSIIQQEVSDETIDVKREQIEDAEVVDKSVEILPEVDETNIIPEVADEIVSPEKKVDITADKTNIVEELSAKLDLGRVFFDYGETELSRMEYLELDRLFTIITDNDQSRWKIIGYTDDREPIQIHQSLGIQRAYFVLRYFMSKGIDRNRFEVDVKGEEDPIASNDTEAGREKNRRVEVKRIR